MKVIPKFNFISKYHPHLNMKHTLAWGPNVKCGTQIKVEGNMNKRAARGQRPPLVGEEVRKEDVGKVES